MAFFLNFKIEKLIEDVKFEFFFINIISNVLGSSTMKGIHISEDDLERAHHDGMACFTSSKPFTKKDDLLNFRTINEEHFFHLRRWQ